MKSFDVQLSEGEVIYLYHLLSQASPIGIFQIRCAGSLIEKVEPFQQEIADRRNEQVASQEQAPQESD